MESQKLEAYERAVKTISEVLTQPESKEDTVQKLMSVFNDLALYGSDETMQQFLRLRQQSSIDEIMKLLACLRADVQSTTQVKATHLKAMFS